MRMHTLAAAAATTVMIPALVACGSSDTKATTTPTNDSSKVTASVDAAGTTAGLNSMVSLAKQVAATDGAAGKKLAEGLEGFWKPIEDGIKAKDPNTYTAIEDAMAGLESGDQAKATQAATDLENAVKAYVAK